jgi:hypothetical protein
MPGDSAVAMLPWRMTPSAYAPYGSGIVCLLLAKTRHRFTAPVHSPQTVRQGSTLWNEACDKHPFKSRVVGKGRPQRFLRIAESSPHPALRATFSPHSGEKGGIVETD